MHEETQVRSNWSQPKSGLICGAGKGPPNCLILLGSRASTCPMAWARVQTVLNRQLMLASKVLHASPLAKRILPIQTKRLSLFFLRIINREALHFLNTPKNFKLILSQVKRLDPKFVVDTSWILWDSFLPFSKIRPS